MAAHRYWRLLFDYSNASTRVAVAELEMRASVGGANLCTGGTPLGSVNDGTNVASRAFDADTGTFWRTGTTPLYPYLGYDFGSPVTVVEAAWTNSSDATASARSAVAQWSDDNVTWRYTTPVVGASQSASAVNTLAGITEGDPPTRVFGVPVRLSPGWPSGPLRARVVGAPFRFDSVDGGRYRIAGNVAIDGTPVVPVARRVRLFHRLTGRLVRETWSAANGDFAFVNIAAGEYIVLTDDYTRLYNAVAADAVQAVL